MHHSLSIGMVKADGYGIITYGKIYKKTKAGNWCITR